MGYRVTSLKQECIVIAGLRRGCRDCRVLRQVNKEAIRVEEKLGAGGRRIYDAINCGEKPAGRLVIFSGCALLVGATHMSRPGVYLHPSIVAVRSLNLPPPNTGRA